MQNCKIYVGNLSYDVTADQLNQLFSEFGTIKESIVITDKHSGRSKGFGFVEYSDPAAAQKAIEALNGKEHEGRSLKVSEAKPQTSRNDRRDY